MMKRWIPVFITLLFTTVTTFAQRVPPNKPVIFKATSTECNVCGLRAWDELKDAIDLYEKDAVIMAVHPLEESQLHTATSTALMENAPQFFGTPSFFVNNHSLPFQWFQEARLMIETFQEREVVAHPFIDYVIEGNELKVQVKTQFFKRTNRPHYVGVYVLEDELVAYQSSRGPEELHSKIVRTHLGEHTFGTLLTEDIIEVNQEFNTNYTLALNPEWLTENLELAVIIWEKRGNTYEVINSNTAFEPTALSTSINVLTANKVDLSVQPTILSNSATIQLELPVALDALNLRVINSLGQQVKNIFSGDLTKGTHTFLLNRSDYGTGGLYFLVAEKNGDRLVEKMIVK